jgi:hypothetical protein
MPVPRAALIGLLAACLHSQPSSSNTSPINTRSLIVDGIGQDAAGVYVSMRNQSYKDLVGYALTIGDRFSSFQVSSTPVIGARRASKVRIRSAGNPGTGQLLIRAALFADGSYEGDASAAAALVIPGMAADVERKRIVMALEPMITDDEPPPFAEVRRRVSEVTTHMDVVSVLEMSGRFPTLGDIRESPFRTQFEAAARAQRDLFLKKLDDTEKQRSVSLKEALTQLSNEYAREPL